MKNKGFCSACFLFSLLQSVKTNVHARIVSLPVQPEFTRFHVPKTADIGNFLALTGTHKHFLFHQK